MRSFGGVLRGRLRLGGMLFREGRELGAQGIYTFGVKKEEKEKGLAWVGWYRHRYFASSFKNA